MFLTKLEELYALEKEVKLMIPQDQATDKNLTYELCEKGPCVKEIKGKK